MDVICSNARKTIALFLSLLFSQTEMKFSSVGGRSLRARGRHPVSYKDDLNVADDDDEDEDQDEEDKEDEEEEEEEADDDEEEEEERGSRLRRSKRTRH